MLLLWLTLLLCSCGGEKPEETTEAPLPAVKYAFASNGETDYAVVRGDGASDTVVRAAAALRKALSEKTGAGFRLYDEFSYASSPEPHAIVVGTLSDSAPEAGIIEELQRALLLHDYVIAVRAGELFILGGSDAALAEGVAWFSENMPLSPEGDLVLESGYTAAFRDEYRLAGANIAGDGLAGIRIVRGTTAAAGSLASRLSALLGSQCGVGAAVVSESAYTGGRAIFVGSARYYGADEAGFNPNAGFKIFETDGNIVFTASGPRACDSAYDCFAEYISSDAFAASPDLAGLSLSGDVTDGREYRMIARTEETDIRVLQSNVLISSAVESDETRAELLADTYLCYAPDVITLNEYIYARGITKAIAPYLKKDYETVEAPYVALYPDPSDADANLLARHYATPILYRKDSGLTLLDSGFSYLSDMISYHGWSYAVFEKNGMKICVFAAHFSDNRDASGKWRDEFAKEVLIEAAAVSEKFGGNLPTVLAGDWYFWKGVLPYETVVSAGYADAGVPAD
ncbi:MAG: hypothetical protein ILO42_02730 [Clostridia bacterium]|nr:hypothetical protein [Clostridia bacterium]